MNSYILLYMAAMLVLVSVSNTITIIKESRQDDFSRTKDTITGKYAIATASLIVLPRGCFISLENKWNFISLCADSPNKSISKILENISSSYDYIMEWNETSQQFIVFSARSPAKPFEEFNANKSYFIYINTASETLSVGGEEFNDTNLSMAQNWNDPYYPYIFDGNISLYLDGLGSDYDYLMKWNGTGQSFNVYARRSEAKPFNTISMGEGQMIYITSPSGTYLFYNKTRIQNG